MKKNPIGKVSTLSGALKKFSPANRILPDLLDAVIEKFEDDKKLEKEALLFTPSRSPFNNKK